MNSRHSGSCDDVLSFASLTNAQVRQRKVIAKTFPRLLREPAAPNCNRSPPPSPAVHDKHLARVWAAFRKYANASVSPREAGDEAGERLTISVHDLSSALHELAIAERTRVDRPQVLLWLSRQGVAGRLKSLEWTAFNRLVRQFLRQVEQHGVREVCAGDERCRSPPLRAPQGTRVPRPFRPLYVMNRQIGHATSTMNAMMITADANCHSIEVSNLNSDDMLRMMKQEARLVRRPRPGSKRDRSTMFFLSTCRTPHERLHVHSSMQHRLTSVMHPQLSRRGLSPSSSVDGSLDAHSGKPLHRSLDSESMSSLARSAESVATVLRLAQAITSHQRNSTADLLDEKSLRSEQRTTQKAHELKRALRQAELEKKAVRAEILTRKRQLARKQRYDMEAAIVQAKLVHNEEVDRRRNTHSPFRLSDFTSSTIETNPELARTIREAKTPLEWRQARAAIDRSETRAKSRRFLMLAEEKEQKLRQKLQSLNGKVRINTLQAAEHLPPEAFPLAPDADDPLCDRLEKVMWISCGDVVIDPRRPVSHLRYSPQHSRRVVVDRSAESPPYSSPLAGTGSWSNVR